MNKKITFPEGFNWGAATAAYQIEGSCNTDGKGESIWDRFSNIPDNIANSDNGNTACDHYNRLTDDMQLIKDIGLKSYRLSFAWTRILPEGKGKVNQKGLDFYKRLIDLLLENNIKPNVTLYHWDLPQRLQDIGGWLNREVTDYFQDYAEIIFREFGDIVPFWATHNEPYVTTFVAHWNGIHAPGIRDFTAALQVAHHVLLSHGKVARVYNEMNYSGELGIVVNLSPVYPASQKQEDIDAAELYDAFFNKWFYGPVFKGRYPELAVEWYKKNVRMPLMEDGDMDLIKTPIDYLGINYYSRALVKYNETSWPLKAEVIKTIDHQTAMGWEYYPQGVYDILKQVSAGNPNYKKIMVTENGAAYEDDVQSDGTIDDERRLNFIREHLKQIHRAIQDGVNVHGYYVWSLMDNFEWAEGFTKRFGLTYVDYETQKRIVKKSGLWYKRIIEENGFAV